MVEKLMIPVDIEHPETWTKTLAMAERLFDREHIEMHVMTVVPPFAMAIVGGFFPEDFEEKAIAAAKENLAALINEQPTTTLPAPHLHVAHGNIYEEILAAADSIGVDLIIVCAHKPDFTDYLLGPNAARVARHAKQSVMVVR